MISTISTQKYTKLIYVIDDARWHNVLTKKMLKDCGYDVITFTSGYTLLEDLKDTKPHLIISDINMPELNGFELCSQIKKMPKCKDIPVMYVTSLSEEEIGLNKNGNCAAGFLQKPLLKKLFLEAVEERFI